MKLVENKGPHVLTLPGATFKRGFWLYVWRIKSPVGKLLYVGRTGDSSSPKEADPYTRMTRHLSHNKNENMLRQRLGERCVAPEDCDSLDLIAYGPLFAEARDMSGHRGPRDKVAALERELAESLASVGYDVLNKVHSNQQVYVHLWDQVHKAFAEHFPKLATARNPATQVQTGE